MALMLLEQACQPLTSVKPMISTATALIGPYTHLGSGPTSPQTSSVTRATPMTAATK